MLPATDQTWTAGTKRFLSITVPEPTGRANTLPYAVVGSLARWTLQFNTTTRRHFRHAYSHQALARSPSVRQTTEGTADWTVDYTTSAFTPTEQAIVLGASLFIDGTQSIYAPSTNDLDERAR